MERKKNPRIQVDLPLGLYKTFKHKLTDEELTAKAAVKQLIELWVKGDVRLPQEPDETTQRKNREASG